MKQKRMFFCEMNEQPSDIVLEAEIFGKVRQMAAFTNYSLKHRENHLRHAWRI